MDFPDFEKFFKKIFFDFELGIWKSGFFVQTLFKYKIRRQFPIEPYIADFVCLELKLIIELDGGQHANHIEYDEQRSLFLEQRGFKVIRFWNNDVMDNTEGVLETIRSAVLESTAKIE